MGTWKSPSRKQRPSVPPKSRSTNVGPLHPPGLYGVQGALIALNAFGTRSMLAPLDIGRSVFPYSGTAARELKWPLLETALIILLIDALISLWLRGYVSVNRRRPRARGPVARPASLTILVLASLFAFAPTSPSEGAPAPQAQRAEGDIEKDLESALDTRLAYVVTGDAETDAMSKAGLFGLGLELQARTAYEPAPPVGVDIETRRSFVLSPALLADVGD